MLFSLIILFHFSSCSLNKEKDMDDTNNLEVDEILPPEAVVLISPVGFIYNRTPTLDWEDSQQKNVTYKVQVASDKTLIF